MTTTHLVHDLQWRKKEALKRAYELPVRVHTRDGRFIFQRGMMVYMCDSLAEAVMTVEKFVGLSGGEVRQ